MLDISLYRVGACSRTVRAVELEKVQKKLNDERLAMEAAMKRKRNETLRKDFEPEPVRLWNETCGPQSKRN
jgi:hypothetical protein